MFTVFMDYNLFNEYCGRGPSRSDHTHMKIGYRTELCVFVCMRTYHVFMSCVFICGLRVFVCMGVQQLLIGVVSIC